MRYCRVMAGCGWPEFRRAEVILLTFFLTARGSKPPNGIGSLIDVGHRTFF